MKKFIFISTIFISVIMTGCTKFPDIGVGYKLDYNSVGDIGIVNSKNSYLVYGHILEYTFDSTFIIVAERPRDSVPECLYLKGEKFKDCERAFEKSTFRQYWIIDKRQKSIFDEKTRIYSNVYGPYNRKKYLEKIKALSIPKKLELKE
jgi:hypothetical protein